MGLREGQVRKFMHLAQVAVSNLTFHRMGGCCLKPRTRHNQRRGSWSCSGLYFSADARAERFHRAGVQRQGDKNPDKPFSKVISAVQNVGRE